MNKLLEILGIFEEGVSRKTTTMKGGIRILLLRASYHWIVILGASRVNLINTWLQVFMRVSIFIQFSWIAELIP